MGIGGVYANEVPDGGTFEDGDNILVARGPYVVAVPKDELPSGGGGSVTVVDNLASTSTTSALSANQGKVLNDLVAASLDARVSTQTASYNLSTDQAANNDGKTYLRMNVASANTVTIPTTQTKPISIRQAGAGVTTIQAGAGVTLFGDAVFTAQHQTKTVIPLGQVGGIGNYLFDIVG